MAVPLKGQVCQLLRGDGDFSFGRVYLPAVGGHLYSSQLAVDVATTGGDVRDGGFPQGYFFCSEIRAHHSTEMIHDDSDIGKVLGQCCESVNFMNPFVVVGRRRVTMPPIHDEAMLVEKCHPPPEIFIVGTGCAHAFEGG